ncbi:hypothetical protein [Ruminococcus bromii]|uniref:hypothetical protein n=1 Tax=Ruminococcus bromii TaxID=40518 RepID=UPI0029312684|nr:hypothetical protein [Ruminococcus bromii]
MAMVDYGVVAIKNGKVINDGMFFMNMLTAVGWVDQKRIRHDDCDCFDDPDPLLAKSNCYYCNKAQKEIVQYENCEDTDAKLIADCHGESFESVSNHIDGNYFAYVGDEHLTLAFYKQHCLIMADKVLQFEMWGIDNFLGCRKSIHFEVAGVHFYLKHLDDRIYYMRFHYKGDNYHIIYGYGIDSSKDTWDNCKVRYLGKRAARKVDNLYARLINK